MADDSGIDPRYAAQFQRGFDASVHAMTPAPAPAPASPPRISAGPPATAPRVAPPPPLVERPAPQVEATPLEGDEEPAPAVRPRLEWALLGAGLLMIAAAVWLFVTWVSEQRRMYAGNYIADLDSLLASAAYENLPGPLFVAGIVAVILWVVLRAVAPARARG